MNKSIIITAATLCFAVSMFTNCSSSAQKAQHEQEKVNNAKIESDEANKEIELENKAHLEEIEKFNEETKAKVKKNNQKIFELNSQLAYEKAELKEGLKAKVAQLEVRNRELSKKLNDYEVTNKENWLNFKAEFNRDMNDLEEALNNFGQKD
jgi:peptidoglycan hydrolase CwlO-like protein